MRTRFKDYLVERDRDGSSHHYVVYEGDQLLGKLMRTKAGGKWVSVDVADGNTKGHGTAEAAIGTLARRRERREQVTPGTGRTL